MNFDFLQLKSTIIKWNENSGWLTWDKSESSLILSRSVDATDTWLRLNTSKMTQISVHGFIFDSYGIFLFLFRVFLQIAIAINDESMCLFIFFFSTHYPNWNELYKNSANDAMTAAAATVAAAMTGATLRCVFVGVCLVLTI